MKFCKITLIVFLVIKSIVEIAKAFLKETNDRFGEVFTTLLSLAITWALYWGAGILDV